MVDLQICFGAAAPYYNLALVLILILLFVYLFKIPNKKNMYETPWKLIFYALIIFIVEEAMTILGAAGMITFPRILFAIFETSIITLFIYSSLLQKENIKNAKI